METNSTDTLQLFLGLDVDASDLSPLQMTVRAIIVFAAALCMLRLAHKRFFAQRNAIDVLLAVILASTLARAINGSAGLVSTITAGFGMVLMHNLITRITWSSHRLGKVTKGNMYVLMRDGQVDDEAIRDHHVSLRDLEQDLRLRGVLDKDAVKQACLERNGEISVIRKTRIYTTQVEAGVQTVRIEVDA